MSIENRYQMWEKQVVGPVKQEMVAHGPFVVLNYPQDLAIEELDRRKKDFLLRQNLRPENQVKVCQYGIDLSSEADFKKTSKVWQSLGVNLQRHMVNEIYATRIETKISLGAVKTA